jgi:hypothetical protein
VSELDPNADAFVDNVVNGQACDGVTPEAVDDDQPGRQAQSWMNIPLRIENALKRCGAVGVSNREDLWQRPGWRGVEN